ncbi:uncharacterized protein LOC126976554 [Leptidea sinapis]|uniref:uncharacterized protein LOC126976554 n=1 Tax=Leptidea sinapis TaxID=189913 RepID=UPI0021C29D4F|nr:uncharacterized protein LOC126976554 [Leptidea sinapis]
MECVGYSSDSRPRSQWTCPSCSPYSKTPQNIPPTSSDTHIPPNIISKIEDKIVTAIRKELQNIIHEVLASELQPLKEQLQLLEDSNTLLNNQYKELLEVVSNKTKEIGALCTEKEILNVTVNDLQQRLSSMEQFARQSNVEIVGIPEHRNEDTNKSIKEICNVVGFSLPSPQDIIFTTRVAKINRESKRPRNLVCQFSNKLVRDNFLAAIINYNKSHKDNKLSSSLLGITGSSVPVYVNEHLTPANKSLHAETRKLAKSNGYKFVWVRSGKIFVRKEETSPAKNILSSEHLHKLFKQQ